MHQDYEHKAQYYETDQMGIIHHSNYIRWMEEARIDLMEQCGCGYVKMEEAGVISPVLSIECKYQSMVYFGDTVRIKTTLLSYNGIKMEIGYEMQRVGDGAICFHGKSEHCFINRENGQLISLKKSQPDWHESFRALLEES
ncbi:MAG: acyl-CoA thioesterase [Clostridia bacterium]|nr:acyl-CoA thioesterase [Clostridia bacterium]